MVLNTAQKMKFSIKDFFSKCDQILRKLRIWSHLLKKSLMEKLIFCAEKQMISIHTHFKNLGVFLENFQSEHDHFLETRHYRVTFRIKNTIIVC